MVSFRFVVVTFVQKVSSRNILVSLGYIPRLSAYPKIAFQHKYLEFILLLNLFEGGTPSIVSGIPVQMTSIFRHKGGEYGPRGTIPEKGDF